jgi:hypothetical protein
MHRDHCHPGMAQARANSFDSQSNSPADVERTCSAGLSQSSWPGYEHHALMSAQAGAGGQRLFGLNVHLEG